MATFALLTNGSVRLPGKSFTPYMVVGRCTASMPNK